MVYNLTHGDGDYWFMSDKTYESLQGLNMTLDFHIGAGEPPYGTEIIIRLPLEALAQTLSYPLSTESQLYVPIRRAINPAQYVLGRTFLQEAFVTVNYNLSKFSVHQAAFPDSGTDLVSLAPSAPKTTKSLIVGIAVGAAALFVSLLAILFILHRIKQRRRRQAAEVEEEEAARIKGEELEISFPLSPDSPSSIAMKIMEIDSETIHEIGGMPRHQVQEIGVPVTPTHGGLPDESTMSEYGGFIQEVVSDRHGHPIIKVYYEMDGTPPGSAENTPTGTLSSYGTTLVGSPAWGSQSSTPNSTLAPLRGHRRVESDALSPIPQTPAEFYERRPAGFFGRLNHQSAGPSSLTPHIGDMSPIPQTPLEYYGTAVRPGEGGNRGWIGRAPPEMPVTKAPLLKKNKSEEKVDEEIVEVPRVVLIPATPAEISEKERERRRWLRGDSRRGGEGSAGGKGKDQAG